MYQTCCFNKNEFQHALGQKVQKKVFQYCDSCVGGLTNTTTDYLSGFQYTTTGTVVKLSFFPHAEGYVNNTIVNGANVYNYVFNYTDHLGNIRLSYAKDPVTNVLKIIEENHYYPFGLKHTNYNSDKNMFQKTETNAIVLKKPIVQTRLEYQIKYQGQERQDELGLNWDSFKWRNYDYAIGRFMSIDPLAEDYTYNSPYAFAENRVVDGRELEGLEWTSVKNDDGTRTRQLTIQMVNNSSLTDKQVSKVTATMQADFAKTYSDECSTAQLIVQPISANDGSCDYAISLNNTLSNTVYDKSTGEVAGKVYAGGETPSENVGQTQKNSLNVTATVDGESRGYSSISRSFLHEVGHGSGLLHPWDSKNTVSDIKQGEKGVKSSTIINNVMNSSKNPILENQSTSGKELTPGQLKSIDALIEMQTKTN